MARVTAQDALEYCLENPDGLGVEEMLERFPDHREELQQLLALSSQIQEITPPPVPAERRAAMKSRLMDAAAAAQQATQVAQVQSAREVTTRPERKPSWIWAFLRRPLFAAGAMAVLVVGLLWWGAATSLPDSPFYNIKLASENFMLNFAGGPEGKARAEVTLANSRADDIKEMKRLGKLAKAGGAIENYRDHINSAFAIWNKTTNGAREDLKGRIDASVTKCEQALAGTNVAALPDSVKVEVVGLNKDLSDIRVQIKQPGVAPSPTPTPVSGTPTASATPSKVSVPSIAASPTPGRAVTATTDPVNYLVLATATETLTPRQSPTTFPGRPSATPLFGEATPRSGATSPTSRSTAQASATNAVLKNTATATSTPVRSRTVSPTSTRQPSRTATPPVISTPTKVKISNTPSKTPSLPATSTPRATATRTDTATYTATATSTATPRPTRTATFTPTVEVEPSRTRGVPPPQRTHTPPPEPPRGGPTRTRTPGRPPADTAVPTNTKLPALANTQVPNPTNTQVPPQPTVTPEPTSNASCELRIEELEIDSACETGRNVEWTAEIENQASTVQRGDWVAVLKIKIGSGPYLPVARLAGSKTFQPHQTTDLGGRFYNLLPLDTKALKVELTMSQEGVQCDEIKEKEKDCEER